MISGASDHFARFDKLPVMGAILGEQAQEGRRDVGWLRQRCRVFTRKSGGTHLRCRSTRVDHVDLQVGLFAFTGPRAAQRLEPALVAA